MISCFQKVSNGKQAKKREVDTKESKRQPDTISTHEKIVTGVAISEYSARHTHVNIHDPQAPEEDTDHKYIWTKKPLNEPHIIALQTDGFEVMKKVSDTSDCYYFLRKLRHL